ncbi:MAG: peptidase [Cyanobacteria bacterium RYN_339]|nr:peptidase [Cyanobacteria bacterium RYN_339]
MLTACGRGTPITATTKAAAANEARMVPGRAVVRWKDAAARAAVAAKLGLSEAQPFDVEGDEAIDLPNGQSLTTFREAAGDAAVTIEPDFVMRLPVFNEEKQAPTAAEREATPLKRQYALQKVDAAAAWKITRGKPAVKIAVIDTGVDENHPDLRGQVAGSEGLVGLRAKLGFGSARDDNGHGTHCAGVVAASGAQGVSGIAPGCKLLVCKVLDNQGNGATSQIARGIGWAVDHGADVISLSMGGEDDARAVRDAVARAISRGVVVVAAMGNEGKEVRNFPAAYPGVIAVGATSSTDKVASFSTRGPWISVCAPGVGILSTTPTYGVTLNNPEAGGIDPVYGKLSGTSMATPLVAGIAALVRSQHASWTPAQIKAAIERGAVAIDGSAASRVGHGRVSAAGALGAR